MKIEIPSSLQYPIERLRRRVPIHRRTASFCSSALYLPSRFTILSESSFTAFLIFPQVLPKKEGKFVGLGKSVPRPWQPTCWYKSRRHPRLKFSLLSSSYSQGWKGVPEQRLPAALRTRPEAAVCAALEIFI